MYIIDKEFHWEGGHRVWSQALNTKFSLDNACVCRHLHGHSYRCKIGLKTEKLNNGMVTDFKHLNFVKEIIDTYFDHKFMIDLNDPNFNRIFPEYNNLVPKNPKALRNYHGFFKYIDISVLNGYTSEEIELIESFVLVDFVPTSENICAMLFKLIKHKMQNFLKEQGATLAFVELWETPKSHCKYTQE